MPVRLTIAMPAAAVARLRERLADGSTETKQFIKELGILGVEFPEPVKEQIVIDEATGEVTMIDSPLAREIADDLGESRTARASHVLPYFLPLRWVFHVLRWAFGEAGRVAAWTRTWKCLWFVDARPAGLRVLDGVWQDRDAAITAEVNALNEYWSR